MKLVSARMFWRWCILGLVLVHLTIVHGQRRQNGRRGQFQVVSSRRRQVAARAPSLTLNRSRGTAESRSRDTMESRSQPIATNGRSRRVQVLRSRQPDGAQRGILHTNIPGPGFDSFIRDNRAFIGQRGATGRSGGRRISARPSDSRKKILARNIEVLKSRGQPKALRMTDPSAARTKTTPARTMSASRTPLPTRTKLKPDRAKSVQQNRTLGRPNPQTRLKSSTRVKSPGTAKPRARATPPVRIRSRLRANSRSPSDGTTVLNSNIKPSPTTSSMTMGNPVTTQKSKISGADMISVDSLLSLIQDIKGSKNGDKTGVKHSKASKTSQTPPRRINVNPTPTTIFSTTPMKALQTGGASSSMKNQNGGKAGNGAGDILPAMDPSIALLAQLSMMNAGGDQPDPPNNPFASFLSNPLLMGALNGATGGDSPKTNAMQKSVQSFGKRKPKLSPKDAARQREIDSLNLLSSKINTGNPLQDQMIKSMLQNSIRNIQEDMKEKQDKKEQKGVKGKDGESISV
ncbi:hypothetical protein ACF0H5_024481 [Mactra antiquata]